MHVAPACCRQQGPAQEPSSASESSWALRQLVTALGKGHPASLSPVLQPTAHQMDMWAILKTQPILTTGRMGVLPLPATAEMATS